jgi:thiosulfate/3-mercaptopyruvate sulfurtransferase
MNRIIEPDQLRARLDSKSSLLVHVSAPEPYAAGHIPGAIHVAPAALICGTKPATGRLPEQEALEDLLNAIGYDPSQTIIAYDDEGGGWAGRFLWTLDVIGHDDWLYLDGGLMAWAGEGGDLETGWPAPRRRDASTSVNIHPKPIAEASDILERLGDSDMVVWDCRSPEEYRGEKIAAARGGHIPGAVNLDWLDLMDPARGLRLRTDLEALLSARGITRDREIITHCQTHHRSGLSYLVGRCLGFPRIRAYHGSWSEWGNRDDTPVETGPGQAV